MGQYVIVQDNKVIATGLRADGDYSIHYPIGAPSDWISAGDEVANGWTYDGSAFSEPTVSVEQLRAARDELLKSSDDMIIRYREHEYLKANNSNTRFDGKGYDNIAGHLTENQYHDWLVYRQDLRDLPDGYTPVADPTYPNKPT